MSLSGLRGPQTTWFLFESHSAVIISIWHSFNALLAAKKVNLIFYYSAQLLLELAVLSSLELLTWARLPIQWEFCSLEYPVCFFHFILWALRQFLWSYSRCCALETWMNVPQEPASFLFGTKISARCEDRFLGSCGWFWLVSKWGHGFFGIQNKSFRVEF